MIDLRQTYVPRDKVGALKAIAARPHGFYTGYVRQFVTPDGELFCIDTRYDDELRRAGLQEDDA